MLSVLMGLKVRSERGVKGVNKDALFVFGEGVESERQEKKVAEDGGEIGKEGQTTSRSGKRKHLVQGGKGFEFGSERRSAILSGYKGGMIGRLMGRKGRGRFGESGRLVALSDGRQKWWLGWSDNLVGQNGEMQRRRWGELGGLAVLSGGEQK